MPIYALWTYGLQPARRDAAPLPLMIETHRSSLTRRRYRLAQAVTVAGSLATGSLIVTHLVDYFRDDIFLFYGVSDTEYSSLQQTAGSQLPATLGQLVVSSIALVAVCLFILMERRRVRQASDINRACRGRGRALFVARLSRESLFDAFVTRTSSFAGLLLAVWLLQSSLERKLGGLGWGLEYAGWRSLLPIASIFGLCVIAGMVVALCSLVGLRAIHVLEIARQAMSRRRRRPVSSPRPACNVLVTARTFRERLGCDILSRPPPEGRSSERPGLRSVALAT